MGKPDPAYEAEYNIRDRHPDHGVFFEQYRELSEQARRTLPCKLDVAYGDGPNMTLDAFRAAKRDAPLLVFIHGGYWRALDKSDFSFPATAFVPAGVSLVSLNYALAPAVTLDEIVEQCRTAIAWLHGHAADLNADPARLYVSGHSAGGHLTAMLMATDWAAHGLPVDAIKGGCAISGVFDLAPILKTSINDDVRLDAEMAARNSPLFHVPKAGAPLVAAVGDGETEAFLDQSRRFAEAWGASGMAAQYLPLAGFHHFDVVLELAKANSPLTRAMLAQIAA